MLITFSGLDGAGKSTMIEWLRESLEKRNERVVVFHMYYDVGVLACARAAMNKLSGRRKAKSPEESERVHAPAELKPGGNGKTMLARAKSAVAWNKSLRMCVYPLDLLIFLFYRLYIEKVKRKVLIMDRYFYDTLVDVTDGRKGYGVRLLSRLTPTPCVPVLVDISAEEAYARKGEHSVAYLSRRRLSYQKVFPKGRSSVVIAGSDDMERTRRALEKIVIERMAAR
jgi:thymidylate kinase